MMRARLADRHALFGRQNGQKAGMRALAHGADVIGRPLAFARSGMISSIPIVSDSNRRRITA